MQFVVHIILALLIRIGVDLIFNHGEQNVTITFKVKGQGHREMH